MKKLFTAACLLILAAGSALANTNNAEEARLNRQFHAEYPGASHVSYQSAKDHVTVHFVLDKQAMQAFYDNEGNKIGTSRAIQLNTLPLAAQRTIAEKYQDYTATEAIEFDHVQTGLNYYVSLQNSSQRVILNISAEGEVSVFKKARL